MPHINHMTITDVVSLLPLRVVLTHVPVPPVVHDVCAVAHHALHLGWHLPDLKSNYRRLKSSKTGFTRVLLFFTAFTPVKLSFTSPTRGSKCLYLLYQMQYNIQTTKTCYWGPALIFMALGGSVSLRFAPLDSKCFEDNSSCHAKCTQHLLARQS